MKEPKFKIGDTVIIGSAPYCYSNGYNFIGDEAIIVDYGGYVDYLDSYVIYVEITDTRYSRDKRKFLEKEVMNKNNELFPIF